MKIEWNLVAASGFAQEWQGWVKERSRIVHVFVMALILAVVTLVSGTPEARAENGDGCAEGYAWGSAPYQSTGPDGQPVMVQNAGCHPISAQDFWGAVAYASVNGQIYANAYWNAYSERLAKKMALADCKKYLREEKISGRCEIVGSGRNGSGWVSQGKNLSLYFGYDENEALSACRRVTVDCRMYAKLRSDGSQQSGVTWFE